jgi:DNA-binding CsgD family transcriptional regulator
VTGGSVVIGRAEERARIDGLLAEARDGRSGVLVLSGEPGVGKSTLLTHAIAAAGDLRVLQAAGVQTEIDLPFAGLHQLLRPTLDLVDRIPTRQADALLGALGLVDHSSEDRFLVAAAALSVLSEAAGDGPVLCVIEDAHWLDHSSVEALAFAARRLDAEGVVLLAATREGPWPGLPGMAIRAFDRDDASRLLRERVPDLVASVADRLVDESGGNPLALVELAASLTPGQLAGLEPLPDSLRLTGRIQEAFLGRVRVLPDASQTLLLVAAADDTGDAAVIFRAAEALDVRAAALEPAERAGLAEVDDAGRIRFRHPLVRTAVYQSATFIARTAAHRALVGALDGDVHVARRAWHLAAAATGPDEGVARELERSAEVAAQRGGYAVASAAYERAAQLSPQRSDRARLLVAAAEAAYHGGLTDRAVGLADRAAAMIDDPVTGDEVACLRGRIELTRGSSLTAHTLLDTAARRIAERDPRAAAAELIHAARAAWNVNDAGRLTATTDLLARLDLPIDDPLGALVHSAVGVGELAAGRPAAAVARIHAATEAWLPLVATGRAGGLDTWVVESWLVMSGTTRIIGDHPAALTLAGAAVAQSRDRGLAARLPFALANLALSEALAGRHSAALVNATEALELARDLGQRVSVGLATSVLAWLAAVRGEEERCQRYARESVELAEAYGLTAIAVFATWALGLLELSLGRPERALDRLRDPTGPAVNPLSRILIVPDLVEAATRVGRPAGLAAEVARFDEWAGAIGQPWAAATVHRCRAMLAGDEAEEHFDAAVREHERGGAPDRPFDRARTQLQYGQWLRRTRRRAAARTQLAAALETFERLGATPWAARAGTELRATGQSVRRPDEPVAARLTPQELQVVRLVAEGGSNSDVAAQLFISPRTVAYHLYKAYPKLGVTARADLAGLDLDALVATQ